MTLFNTTLDESYKNHYNQVGLFHEVFGHPLNKIPQTNIFSENPKLVAFRISLIEEEFNEFVEAVKLHDFIEAIDAICDMLYVLNGALHAFGVSYPNNDHVPPLVLSIDKYPNNDVFKNNMTDINEHITTFEKLLCRLKTSTTNNNFDAFVSTLHQFIVDCYSASSNFGINVDDCFDEVQSSNMSKVCTSEEEAIETVKWYKENDKRYEDPQYRKSVNELYWVIYDGKTSKILKSINFRLPDLKNVSNYIDNSKTNICTKG